MFSNELELYEYQLSQCSKCCDYDKDDNTNNCKYFKQCLLQLKEESEIL